MRDVNNGWLVRYLHSNTASAFFFLVYLHIGRGIYYGSYRSPRTLVWAIGTVILILMIGTAFLGFSEYSPKWYRYINYYNRNYLDIATRKLGYSISNSTFYSGRSSRNYTSRRFHRTGSNKDISPVVQEFLKEKNLNPVFIYENLNNQETKYTIKKDVDNISGVYLIFNKGISFFPPK